MDESVVGRLRAAGCVFAEDEARVLVEAAGSASELERMVEQRVSGVPLEQVVGWAEFCGRRVRVGPGVFVPRRRTEFLVRQALALARRGDHMVVVDLCCGSGAVGLAVAEGLRAAGTGRVDQRNAGAGRADLRAGAGQADPRGMGAGQVDQHAGAGAGQVDLNGAGRVELYAVDVEAAAVACARRNLGESGQVYLGDLYEPLPDALRGRVDVLTANVPYVPSGEVALLPAEAREHEPRVALDGGADGLGVLRRVAAGARGWLAPGGILLTEASERQAEQAAAILSGRGLVARIARCDELGATVVMGAAGPG